MWLIGALSIVCAVAVSAEQYPLQCRLETDSILSAYVAEWQAVSAEVTNHSDNTVRFITRVIFSKEGRLLARTALPRQQVWTLAPGETIRIDRAALIGRLLGESDPRSSDRRWQPLPDTGKITFCVHVTDSLGKAYLAAPLCQTVRVVSYQVPVPLSPTGDDTLVIQRGHRIPIRMVWMPILPLRKGTCYVVRCFPLPDSLGIAEAVRVQQPILEHRLCDAAHYVWKGTQTISPGRYVWTVQARDHKTDLPIGSSDGYSMPATFVIAAPSVRKLPFHYTRKKRR